MDNKKLPPLKDDLEYQDMLRMLRKQSPEQIDKLEAAMDRIFEEVNQTDER